jgi:hypothetical protein
MDNLLRSYRYLWLVLRGGSYPSFSYPRLFSNPSLQYGCPIHPSLSALTDCHWTGHSTRQVRIAHAASALSICNIASHLKIVAITADRAPTRCKVQHMPSQYTLDATYPSLQKPALIRRTYTFSCLHFQNLS